MPIEIDILIAWGGVAKKYKRGEYIFYEGDTPLNYYQILHGTVKMCNTNIDGKEFTQAEFKEGSSFGEPPLFIEETYPASAVATEDVVILKIIKEKYLQILEEYPKLKMDLLCVFARRLFNKATTVRELVNNNPETRIIAFLNAFKKKENVLSKPIEIPFTRQEIANFTGLRVETVIRTLAKMKEKNKVKIVERKLIY
jgi:CRP/FNR family transcriptional regulator